MEWIKKATYLGIVFFLAILLVKPIGVSTQFSVVSGILHKAIDEQVITEDDLLGSGYESSNEYYNKSDGKLAAAIMNPWNYDFVFVLAIPLGALIGEKMYGKKEEMERDFDRTVRLTQNRPTRPLRSSTEGLIKNLKMVGPSFLAGFLLLYGARLADGCTSGHMMSGIMQGSISGYAFAVSVFLVAIPTALIIGRRQDKTS